MVKPNDPHTTFCPDIDIFAEPPIAANHANQFGGSVLPTVGSAWRQAQDSSATGKVQCSAWASNSVTSGGDATVIMRAGTERSPG
jgi:hypothetical protein